MMKAGHLVGFFGGLLLAVGFTDATPVADDVEPSDREVAATWLDSPMVSIAGAEAGRHVPIEVAKLLPIPDMTGQGALAGRAVAVDGDTMVVGIVDDQQGPAAGAAVVFERDAGGPGAWGQVAKLLASDGAEGDEFGSSVSISWNTVVVGAIRADAMGSSSGAAYVFERDAGGPDAWGQVAKLAPPDLGVGDNFGSSTSISGDTIVVGAARADGIADYTGAAYVFERDHGGGGTWGQVARLVASDGTAWDNFGNAVSIQGDTVAVGAYSDDFIGSYAGSAYTFGRNVGGADAWGQEAKLLAPDGAAQDYFGSSITVSGDSVVVGSPRDDDNGGDSGSAFVFNRNLGGPGAWGFEVKILAPDGTGWNLFGCSVALEGDTLVVGARYKSETATQSGSAYVFGRNNGGAGAWGMAAKLWDPGGGHQYYFGAAVSISGDTTVIGAPTDDDLGGNAGSIHVFERNHGGPDAWGRTVELGPPIVLNAREDYFGHRVAADGDILVVGAWRDDDLGYRSGAVYIFYRNHTGPDAWGLLTKLLAPDGDSWDGFGSSVSIDGDRIVVGAYSDDDYGSGAGSATIFERNHGGPDAWGQIAKIHASDPSVSATFGTSVSISGDTVVVGASGDSSAGPYNHGSAYVFERDHGGAGAWGQVVELAPDFYGSSDRFGRSVSISGDTIVVGVEGDDDNGTSAGAAYVYDRDHGGPDAWGRVVKLLASDGSGSHYFGTSVGISGSTVVVGAWQGRAAYVFDRNHGGAGAWGEVAILLPPDGVYSGFYGGSVFIDGDTVLVGARAHGGSGVYTGAAFAYDRDQGGADAWGEIAQMLPSDGLNGDGFGDSVCSAGDEVVVGASGRDDYGSRSGAAYIYEFLHYPEVDGVGSIPPTADEELTPGEWSAFGFTGLSAGFSEPMADPVGHTDPGDVTNPANWLLFEAGEDGVFATSSCAGGVTGDDIALSPNLFIYDGATQMVSFRTNGGAALPSGLYTLFACPMLESEIGLTLDGDGDGMAGDEFAIVFGIDEVAPVNPVVWSTTHTVGHWSADSEVQISWSGASDRLSGLLGYSYVFDTETGTEPDTTIETVHTIDPHQIVVEAATDDAGWHLHIRACDQLGNCSAALHFGPLSVDTTGPETVSGLGSTSHTSGVPSNDLTIDVEWVPAIDHLSGVAGYGVDLAETATWVCDEVQDVTGTAATLSAPGGGSWYVHVCAVDAVGNWGAVVSEGPFEIDTTAPEVLAVGGEGGTEDGVLLEGEAALVALTQLRIDFSEPIDPVAGDRGIADPSHYRVVDLGNDGVLSTAACDDPLGGDDVEIPIVGAWAWGDEETVSIQLEQETGTTAGRYALLVCEVVDQAGNPRTSTWVRHFMIEADNLIRNPNFDYSGELEWDLTSPNAADIRFLSQDPSTEASGVAVVDPISGAGEIFELTQCIEVFSGTPYALGGIALVDSGLGDAPTLRASVQFFHDIGCIDLVGVAVREIVSGDTAWRWTPRLLLSARAPSKALSARVGFVVEGGTAEEFAVYLDETSFFVDTIFIDGFESGDSSWWTTFVATR